MSSELTLKAFIIFKPELSNLSFNDRVIAIIYNVVLDCSWMC